MEKKYRLYQIYRKYHISMIFLRKIIFHFLSIELDHIFGGKNTIFADNARKIILQCSFLGQNGNIFGNIWKKKVWFFVQCNSYRTMVKTMTKDTYSKFMLSILKSCNRYRVICRSYPKQWKLIRARNLCVILKKNYVTYIKALRQSLVYGLVQEKTHKLIKFNQENWLKTYKV